MAEGVSEKIDLDEKKKYLRDEKTEDRLYKKTEEDRLYRRDLREKEKKLTGDIAEQLALYYTPDQIQDILPSGRAGSNYAIAFGAQKAKLGEDPSLYYTLNKEGVVKPTNPEDVQESSFDSDTENALGSKTFVSRFNVSGPTKKDKTLAERQLRLTDDLLKYKDNPTELARVEEEMKQFLNITKSIAEAKDTSDTTIKDFYSPSQRLDLIKNQRKMAQNALDLNVGEFGELKGKFTGTNKLGIAELNTAIMLQNQNDVVAKEESLYGEIKAIAKNARVTLDSYATSKILAKDASKYQIFDSETLMKDAAASGGLPIGSVYATRNPEGGYQIGTYVGSAYADVGIPSYLSAANVGANFFKAE